MSQTARTLLAGLLASAAFLTIFHVVNHPALFPGSRLAASIGLALAAYAGLALALPRQRSLAERISANLGDTTVTAEEAATALTGARNRVAELRAGAADLPSRLQVRAASLADVAERIVRRVEDDPGDLRRVGRFLRRDLSAAADLVDRYVKLDTNALDRDRAADVTKRFEGALTDYERLFQKHHARTYDDEVFELEARLQLLEERSGKPGS